MRRPGTIVQSSLWPAMSRYEPMRAVLSNRPFSDPDWLFERKLDGVRCGALCERGEVKLTSRSGQRLNGT